MRLLRNRRYVYFWCYRPGPTGSKRVWTYVGPVSRPSAKVKAAELLIEYHRTARRELDRRIGRLLAASGGVP